MATDKQIANILPYTFAQRPVSEARAIQSKGGRTPSPKRAIANRLKALRKKGLTDTTALHIWEAMTMPDVSSYDQYMYLKKMESMLSDDPRERAIYAKLMADWHKLHHGDKKKDPDNQTVNIQPVTINIQINDGNKPRTKQEASESPNETSGSDND